MCKRIQTFSILAILVFQFFTLDAFAGAWGQKKGKFFFSMQTYYYESSRYFNNNGHLKHRGGAFRKWEINPYMEWGVTHHDTLIANLFYDWLSDDATGSTRKTQGFADMELGWQHLLLNKGGHAFSIQGLILCPTGYSIHDDPRLGYGCWGMEGGFLYGRSFNFLERYGFVDLGLGYRKYFGYPSSQIRPRLTVGWDVFKHLQLIGEGKLEYGLKDGSQRQLGRNLIAQPNYRLLKLSFGATCKISETCSFLIAVYRHAWGEDTGGGGGAYASLWFHF
jgi:hypothetical protein